MLHPGESNEEAGPYRPLRRGYGLWYSVSDVVFRQTNPDADVAAGASIHGRRRGSPGAVAPSHRLLDGGLPPHGGQIGPGA